jgi:hypothetical protein
MMFFEQIVKLFLDKVINTTSLFLAAASISVPR